MTGPIVRDYMSDAPVTIGVDMPLSEAHRRMREHLIRHLPVLDAGDLVGVVTMRDLHLVETLRGVVPEEVPVRDAMTPDPYVVRPRTPLARAARHMARKKLGSAVVVERGRVVGIFTAVDAMRALADLIEGKKGRRA